MRRTRDVFVKLGAVARTLPGVLDTAARMGTISLRAAVEFDEAIARIAAVTGDSSTEIREYVLREAYRRDYDARTIAEGVYYAVCEGRTIDYSKGDSNA